jgi:hypothetical protein
MPKRNVIALLERARSMVNPPTWYQLSKRTGIADTTISRCMRRGGTLGDINAVKLGKLLGMDAATVIAYMAADRAKDEPTKQFWSAQLPRLLPSIAIATAGIGALAAGISLIDGQHQGLTPQLSYAWGFASLYIIRNGVLIATGVVLAWAISRQRRVYAIELNAV